MFDNLFACVCGVMCCAVVVTLVLYVVHGF